MWTDITLSDGQIGDADVGKADEPGNKYTLNTCNLPNACLSHLAQCTTWGQRGQ